MADKVTFTSVIKNRGFRYLWFNQILVQLAYNTLNFALIIWVFKLVDSTFAVSILMLAMYLPAILFGIFAGVFVDIADRRKIILLIDIFLVVAFLLFILIKRSYPLILLNTFFVNSLAQFFLPSESSSIPMLVSKKQLFLANSLFSLTLYGAFMIGFSIGGPILNHWGINAVFYLGAVVLFLAFIMSLNLPIIKVSKIAKEFDNFISLGNIRRMFSLTVQEGKETLEFVQGKLTVAAAIGLMAVVQGVVGVLAVIMPSYLERVLRIHATDASYFVMIPLGLGMVVGASLIGRLCHNWPRRLLVIPAVMSAGVMFVLAAVVPFLVQYFQSAELPLHISRPRYFFLAPSLSSFFAIVAFITGVCMVSIVVPCQTVLQENTPQKNRGKIFAVLAVVMTAFAAVPVILAGGLADLFGVTPILTGMGMVVTLIGLIVWCPHLFFNKAHLPFRIRQFLGLGHWEN